MTPLSNAEQVLAELASWKPEECDPGCGCCSSGRYSCRFCGKGDWNADYKSKPEDHAETCIWRRAKELA